MVHARITPPPPDPREQALARTLGIPDLVARVLLARGIDDPERVRDHLRPDLRRLADPFLFASMQTAVDRVQRALRQNERIVVHGDYDVDGVSGTVLLVRFLRLLHADVKPFIPARADGYSFTDASVRAILEHGCRLVISVDNGTNATGPIERIQQAGCDVIVTDHHGTNEHVATAFALLNPRLPDAGYPDRNLAGVGVAFRLAMAVAETCPVLMRSPEFAEFLGEAMTMVALGTIADVAPLCGENRALVFHGLRALAQNRSPGILALLDAAGLSNRSPDVEDVAFRIAPLINAAGRMGHAMSAVELLMAKDYSQAQQAAKVLEAHNEERRKVERELQERVLELARRSVEPAVVLGGDDWHPGVLGIVAARVTEQTGKPAVLVAFRGGVGRGSGRASGGFHLRDALAACGEHLLAHGGHAAAAGLEVKRECFDRFRDQFMEVCRAREGGGTPEPVDGSVAFAELDPATVRKLDLLAPFGTGNRRPRFLTRNVQVVGHPATDARGQDLRLRVVCGGQLLPARVVRAGDRFEEVRSRPGPWSLVHTPRLNSRGEEGPIYLEVHKLFAESTTE